MVRSKAGTNGEATIKIPKINMYFDQQNPQYQTSVTTIMKPLRIFQFVRIGHLINSILNFGIDQNIYFGPMISKVAL